MFHLKPSKPSHPLKFPVWKYLSQPLFSQAQPFIVNPYHFWCFYQVQFLEYCLRLECHSSPFK